MLIDTLEIKSTGHAGFIVKGRDKTIAFDPYKIKSSDARPVDIIFITHSHHDHCSPADIEKLITPNTIIVVPPDCISKVSNLKFGKLIPVEPDQEFKVDGILIETIPAYNTDKNFHSRESDWVGYIVSIGGKTIFHAGDSDATPEMLSLEEIDIAFLPVGGTYTMTAEEAAKAASTFRPKVVIPMHYGSVVGSKDDAERFRKLVKESEVIIFD